MVAFPRLEDGIELMERPEISTAELEAGLADLARLNRLFGGTALVIRHLARLAEEAPRHRPLRVLDLGTGGGDVPVAVAEWGRRMGRALEVTAIDRDPRMVAIARRRTAGYPEIRVRRADALRLEDGDGTADIVLCSLMLHHLSDGDAVALLRRMDRMARVGFIVNDLRRDRASLALTWLGTRLFATSRLVRHDGPMSIRRAFTLPEYRRLMAEAGLTDYELRPHPFCRVALVYRHPHPLIACAPVPVM